MVLKKKTEKKVKLWYVTMNDKFMSNLLSKSAGKTNKLIFLARSYQEAKIVADNAKDRDEMKYINITSTKPSFDPKRFYVQRKSKKVYPNFYRKDAFKDKE